VRLAGRALPVWRVLADEPTQSQARNDRLPLARPFAIDQHLTVQAHMTRLVKVRQDYDCCWLKGGSYMPVAAALGMGLGREGRRRVQPGVGVLR